MARQLQIVLQQHERARHRSSPGSARIGARGSRLLPATMVDSPDLPAGNRAFLTTRWSLVQRAGGADAEQAREALAALCETYWYPLYTFVRCKGVQAEDAA